MKNPPDKGSSRSDHSNSKAQGYKARGGETCYELRPTKEAEASNGRENLGGLHPPTSVGEKVEVLRPQSFSLHTAEL
jgi:hypothetical protein